MTTRVLECAGCSSKLKAKAELAGKTVKCPRCGQPIRIPAAVEPADDWIDITEAYVRPDDTPPPRKLAAPPTDGWGEELLEEQEVPDDMREAVREALTKGERLTWAGRPLLDVMMHRARKQRLVGVAVAAGAAVVLPVLAWVLFGVGNVGATVAGCLVLFMMLVLVAVGVYMLGAPGRTQRGAARRSCYLLTTRRLLIHPGSGTQGYISRGGNEAEISFGTEQSGLQSYSPMELLGLRRNEDKAFPGTGELILRRDLLDEPAGTVLFAVEGLHDLEKRVREQLIHPVIDKVLRGEVAVKDTIGRAKEGKGEVLPTDGNLKEYAKEELPTDGNVKSRKSPLEASLKKIDAELLERVEAELTEGERLLWVGQPEGKTKGRGIVGALAGAAERVEPEYHLYALTSRRVILWDKKGTKDARFAFGNEDRGPVTYYPPAILDAELEDDGGSIVFRRVKVTITTEGKNGKESTRKELHHFGLLRIRDYAAVARAVFHTLIQPCRRG